MVRIRAKVDSSPAATRVSSPDIPNFIHIGGNRASSQSARAGMRIDQSTALSAEPSAIGWTGPSNFLQVLAHFFSLPSRTSCFPLRVKSSSKLVVIALYTSCTLPQSLRASSSRAYCNCTLSSHSAITPQVLREFSPRVPQDSTSAHLIAARSAHPSLSKFSPQDCYDSDECEIKNGRVRARRDIPFLRRSRLPNIRHLGWPQLA